MQNLCFTCGAIAFSKNKHKGTIGIEAGLFLISVMTAALNLFLGGLVFITFVIYCIWRLSSKHKVCPNCENTTVIPVNSPVAQNFLRR